MEVLSLLFATTFLFVSVLVSLLLLAGIKFRDDAGEDRVLVVVLGDVGRSPRMQYHCLSLVQQSYNVDLVGLGGSPVIKELQDNSRLSVHFLPDLPHFVKGLPTLVRFAVKVLFQTATLFWVILKETKKPSHVLIQTPPAIPTLMVAVATCMLRGSKLIVDYHNYAYTMMSLSLGKKHPLVYITRYYEKTLSHFADASLCVSEAMKNDLKKNWGIHALIMYDRPPHIFRMLTNAEKHELFVRLSQTEKIFRAPDDDSAKSKSNVVRTAFSVKAPTGIRLLDNRPFLVVSSTSWTEDEDFSVLLKALEIYDAKAQEKNSRMPPLVCIITGKGPMKAYYEELIESKKLKVVTVSTMWLASEDYPALLGSADLGVCLHKSSSGLDLPMKIVDMFGCGLPVCAINFECLHELLRHNHNGLIFTDHEQLADQLQQLTDGFPKPNAQLGRFRDNLMSFQSLRWDHYWKLHVLPIITGHY